MADPLALEHTLGLKMSMLKAAHDRFRSSHVKVGIQPENAAFRMEAASSSMKLDTAVEDVLDTYQRARDHAEKEKNRVRVAE